MLSKEEVIEVIKYCQEHGMTRKEAYPVIRLFEKWCEDTYAKVLESSMMGHARPRGFPTCTGRRKDTQKR